MEQVQRRLLTGSLSGMGQTGVIAASSPPNALAESQLRAGVLPRSPQPRRHTFPAEAPSGVVALPAHHPMRAELAPSGAPLLPDEALLPYSDAF
jgi:hypothetical protein